jgi:predicted AlkP superfamily pyrophosphatase or phosphodiesterase
MTSRAILSKKCCQRTFQKKTYRKNNNFCNALPAHDSSVLFDYINLYGRFMCDHTTQQAIKMCVNNVVLPPIQEQYDVVYAFHAFIQHVGHMHGLEGVLLKFLVTHDDNAINHLAQSLEEYNQSIETIKSIVAYSENVMSSNPSLQLMTPFSN